MKVIGISENGDYIATVTHNELEKFLGQYYGKLPKLQAGQSIDLGRGYDYFTQTKECFRLTKEFVSANEKVISAILNGLRLD